MLEMPSNNSMVMIGRVELLKCVKIASRTRWVAVPEVDLAEDLAHAVVSELVEGSLAEEVTVVVSVLAADMQEVGMEVAQAWVPALVVLAVLGLLVLALRLMQLHPMRQTLSLTTQPLVVNVAPQSMSAM